MFTLQTPGDVCEVDLQAQGLSKNNLKEQLDIFVTYDPMNLGEPVDYNVGGDNKTLVLKFEPKYGAHIRFAFDCAHGRSGQCAQANRRAGCVSEFNANGKGEL